ncbi:methyltransferase [Streptomyces sp. NPDC048172]|uniref:methyltransferase n=1 Tax=Streptomyces sp. NPDC048172 TaxID=3365505 RepID=UPI00371DC3D0
MASRTRDDTQEQHDGTGRAAARAVLARLANGRLAAEVLGTATRTGVIDLLGDGARTADEVARELDTDPGATLRLLRALTALGTLTETARAGTEPAGTASAETAPGEVAHAVFALTEMGAQLRTDLPESLHAVFRLVTDPGLVRHWEHLDDALRTGGSTFAATYGADIFTYLRDRPGLAAEYHAAMGGSARQAAADVPVHYDFGRFATVVDVGGGDGTLLSAVLRAYPGTRGVLYDTAEGLARARVRMADAGLTGRCALEPGDFFAAAPAGGDLYLLKSVLHDWDDERCGVILRNIRRAMADGGRLLVVETVLPPTVQGEASAVPYLTDVNMLLTYGGRERTRAEYEALCHGAGFEVTSVTPLPAPDPYSLIEAAPAGTSPPA